MDGDETIVDPNTATPATPAMERDPDHISTEELEALTAPGSTPAAAAPGTQTPATPVKPAAPVGAVQPAGAAAPQQAPAPQRNWYETRGFKSEYDIDRTMGALVHEVRELRARVAGGGQQPGQQAGGTPAVQQPKLPKNFHEALGLDPEMWDMRGKQDAYGLFAELQGHMVENHPVPQAAVEKVARRILEPYVKRLDELAQFKQGSEEERQIDAVGGKAKELMQQFIASEPDLVNNPAAKKEFAKLVADEIEDVYAAVNAGRNPFKRMASEILWRNRATLSAAEADAANKRMLQTGAALAASPKPGAGATQLIPATQNERTYAEGRKHGVSDSDLDNFLKAASRYDD